jgi:lipopolysaccharide biosynthesis regulator YciM
MLGLNFLVTDQIDPAIQELTKAAQAAGDALEIHMILGNLYREKGQVGRAIQEHQALLQRPNLRKLEHANVLLCLGLDYKRGGFVDRALEDEEQQQWSEAYAARQKLAAGAAQAEAPRHQRILAFLEGAIGRDARKAGDSTEAARRFDAAVDLDPANAPAHLSLGDVRLGAGDTAGAIAAWERLVTEAPDRSYLAFSRLEAAYADAGEPGRFQALCRRLIDANPQDWRARLALARHLSSSGRAAEALDLLFDALVVNPHALALHQAIWETLSLLDLPPALVKRYIELTRASVFYLDPHICIRCRYRSTELLWQCPHCHEWDSFVEERIAPVKDPDTLAL